MDILNPKILRDKAQLALRRGRDPKKLVYTYAGITTALSLGVLLLTLYLDKQISGTGGLGAFADRAMLSAIQQTLPFVTGLVGLCLEFGYLAGMLRISRGQYADHTDLKAGFRKFWAIARLMMLQGFLITIVGFACVNLSTLIYMLTPWSEPLMAFLEPYVLSGQPLAPETVMGAYELMIPMFLIFAVMFLVLAAILLFRFRMANFFLLDDPRGGAMAALRQSRRMMKGKFLKMLKLDLSLWLYYLAAVFQPLLLNVDLILLLLGVEIPLDAATFSLLLSIASLAVQFAILVTLRNPAEATYILAYDSLREKPKDSGVVLGNIFDL